MIGWESQGLGQGQKCLTKRWLGWCHLAGIGWSVVLGMVGIGAAQPPRDPIAELQTQAMQEKKSPILHWGSDPNNYLAWGSHSNRLVPVYTFGSLGPGTGTDLADYTGDRSIFRNPAELRRLFGEVPAGTLHPEASYMDQTDIYRLQQAALARDKKYIFLVIFDGMSWQATRAAAIARTGRAYHEGKGQGLFFLDYPADNTAQFAWMVTSPYGNRAEEDVDTQQVRLVAAEGGYDPTQAGFEPWSPLADQPYIIGTAGAPRHVYTDSAASGTSMAAGIKTYNNSIGIDTIGQQVQTIAHKAQQQGYAVGTVTSVPISHATPASMYAHNVSRRDYQDLTRDMVGLPSVAHPTRPLPGLDVVLGAGWGELVNRGSGQGQNFVAGNEYITKHDLMKIDQQHGGSYQVVQRTTGQNGKETLLAAAQTAAANQHRLFGIFGVRNGHLPYRTTNGDYSPVLGRSGQEIYSPADIRENPRLQDLTQAALIVLAARADRFWLMVEPGDVDFAMHDNNLDNMIGAIYDGEQAVRRLVEWVELHSNWEESFLILTADHAHYLVLREPDRFAKLMQPIID